MFITITLPERGELLAEKGTTIAQGDPLYRTKKEEARTINIAQKLKIKPQAIFNVLTKVVGENVKKNEVIASQKGFLSARTLRADHDGVIEKIDHLSGHVTVRIDKDANTIIQSFFTGTIKDRENNHLIIEIEKGIAIELEMASTDWGSASFYLTDETRYFTINEEDIKNKTVIAEHLTPQMQVKCEALGAAGFLLVKKNRRIDLPHAIFKNPEEWIHVVESKKPSILCSALENKAVIYE